MKIVGPRSLERQSTFYATKISRAHAQFVPVKLENTLMPKSSISANKKYQLPTKLWKVKSRDRAKRIAVS